MDPSARSLGGLFVRSAREHSGRPALVVDGVGLSYAELGTAAAAIGAALREARREPSARLTGILASRTSTAYAGVLGALLAGHTYVPLNPRFPVDRLCAIVAAAGLTSVIVDGRAAHAARELAERASRPLTFVFPETASPPDWAVLHKQHRFVSRIDLDGCATELIEPDVGTNDGAYLLFTSGSTGLPKGVLIRNRNVLAYLAAARARYQPGPADRFTQIFDLSFDLSVHDMFLCWAAGASLYCIPESAKLGPRDIVRRNDLTFWFSVPSTASSMARLRMLREGDFPSLRWSLFCGEPLPLRLAEAWSAAAPNSVVENLYGPTEATIAFTTYRLPPHPTDRARLPETVPIGQPFDGLEVSVIGEDGVPVPDGRPGELCLGGAQVADGYWGAAELTLKRFAPPRGASRTDGRWYRTGDRVAMSAEYGLLFLGRTDSQTKIGGYRVDLQEVEEVVRRVSGAASVAAIAWPVDADGFARGVLVFVAGGDAADSRILTECRRLLPSYMVPSGVRRLDEWPLTASGKTDRRALASLAQEEPR